MPSPKNVVIVGAGIAGLTLAARLSEKLRGGVTVIEREDRVGGLARTFRYGNFIFDIGPHRFHTDSPQVRQFIEEVLDNDYLVIPRMSAVFLFNRYFKWPLGTSAVFKMPLRIMLGALRDLLHRKDCGHESESFTEYSRASYGDTIFNAFFRDYTERFIRIPCDSVHADWAQAGVNRAVIDKRAKAGSLGQLVRSVLLPRPVHTKFIYPAKGGINTFCKNLASRIEANGGKVLLGTQVSQIRRDGNRVNSVALSNDDELPCDALVWSGELLSLCRLLDVEAPPLRYLSLVQYNVTLKGSSPIKQQWIYFADSRMTVSRVSIPQCFSPGLVPPGHYSLAAEITCFEGEDLWRNPAIAKDTVIKDLTTAQLIGKKGQVLDIFPERIANAYPVYDMAYRRNTAATTRMIKDAAENVELLGRLGTFWYNNMDHSMLMAMDMTRHILEGTPIADRDDYFKFKS